MMVSPLLSFCNSFNLISFIPPMNLKMLHRIDLEVLVACPRMVIVYIDVMNMVYPHPLEGMSVIILRAIMEGGKVVLLERVIVTVTHNLIGIQVRLQQFCIELFLSHGDCILVCWFNFL